MEEFNFLDFSVEIVMRIYDNLPLRDVICLGVTNSRTLSITAEYLGGNMEEAITTQQIINKYIDILDWRTCRKCGQFDRIVSDKDCNVCVLCSKCERFKQLENIHHCDYGQGYTCIDCSALCVTCGKRGADVTMMDVDIYKNIYCPSCFREVKRTDKFYSDSDSDFDHDRDYDQQHNSKYDSDLDDSDHGCGFPSCKNGSCDLFENDDCDEYLLKIAI